MEATLDLTVPAKLWGMAKDASRQRHDIKLTNPEMAKALSKTKIESALKAYNLAPWALKLTFDRRAGLPLMVARPGKGLTGALHLPAKYLAA